jgi:hypothetical protein
MSLTSVSQRQALMFLARPTPEYGALLSCTECHATSHATNEPMGSLVWAAVHRWQHAPYNAQIVLPDGSLVTLSP